MLSDLRALGDNTIIIYLSQVFLALESLLLPRKTLALIKKCIPEQSLPKSFGSASQS